VLNIECDKRYKRDWREIDVFRAGRLIFYKEARETQAGDVIPAEVSLLGMYSSMGRDLQQALLEASEAVADPSPYHWLQGTDGSAYAAGAVLHRLWLQGKITLADVQQAHRVLMDMDEDADWYSTAERPA